MQLIFPGNSFQTLRDAMLSFASETCAILFAIEAKERFIVIERHVAPAGAYTVRDNLNAQLSPEFLTPLIKRARDNAFTVIFCHTHPTEVGRPSFSVVDDEGEGHLAAFLKRRIPDLRHLALVLSPEGVSARLLGEQELVRVLEIGRDVRTLSASVHGHEDLERWDRQVRAFGRNGQAILRGANVAVVGCGGTGSVVAQQLAHLGISTFTLIDPDHVEASNLNRVVGASSRDVGRAKVEVTAALIKELDPRSKVTALIGDVRDPEIAGQLTGMDVIFACTDSHASRAIINQIAYQYVIPTFDVGISIQATNGHVSRITGRSQMLAPGLGCLVCGNALDWAEVRRELQTDAERSLDHYIIGDVEPQPAVISLNSTMSSLTVTMFMAAFAGIPANARLQFYDGVDGRVRSAVVKPSPTCVVCSSAGAYAKPDRWPLPTWGRKGG